MSDALSTLVAEQAYDFRGVTVINEPAPDVAEHLERAADLHRFADSLEHQLAQVRREAERCEALAKPPEERLVVHSQTCQCGSVVAYDPAQTQRIEWVCRDYLLKRADTERQHDSFPFWALPEEQPEET